MLERLIPIKLKIKSPNSRVTAKATKNVTEALKATLLTSSRETTEEETIIEAKIGSTITKRENKNFRNSNTYPR